MTAVTIQELSQSRNLLSFIAKPKSFSNTFIAFCIKEWNKLHANQKSTIGFQIRKIAFNLFQNS